MLGIICNHPKVDCDDESVGREDGGDAEEEGLTAQERVDHRPKAGRSHTAKAAVTC